MSETAAERQIANGGPHFRPSGPLRSAHLQTLWANWAPRPAADARVRIDSSPSVVSTGGPGPADRLRLHWTPPRRDDAPVLVVLHGLTGCADSPGVAGVAAKGRERGFEVVRVDLRNAPGATPSVGVGHAGRSEDARAVLDHVRAERPSAAIAVVGFSLGGNVALKAAGELGDDAPAALRAVVGISVPIDLDRCCRAIDAPLNLPYRAYFLRRLRRTVRSRASAYPHHYEGIELPSALSLRAFDDAVVAPLGGFRDAADYYARSSALRVLADVRVPTLLIEAEDDPFIPFDVYDDARIRTNRRIRLLATRHGGHAGFWAPPPAGDRDAFWAENRAVDFAARAVGLPWSPRR